MVSSKNKKTLTTSTTTQSGLVCQEAAFRFRNEDTGNAVIAALSASGAKTSTVGSGLLKFEGVSIGDGLVFVGATASGVRHIKTSSHEGFLVVEDLLKKDSTIRDDVELATATFSCLGIPATVKDLGALGTAFEAVQATQGKTIPKVTAEKNSKLSIGSKTGENYISLGALANKADGSIKELTLSLKVKGKIADKIWQSFLFSTNVSFITVVAAHINNTISKLVVNDVLLSILTELRKKYSIGQVVAAAALKKAKGGLVGNPYVLRSLSGILKKLKSPDSSKETQETLISWFTAISADKENPLPDADAFFSKLAKTLPKPKRGVEGGEGAKPTN